jgi:DNA-binding transcriptional ArsR family regulator
VKSTANQFFYRLKGFESMRDRLQSDRCAPLLKALADPERLRIVQCLRVRPKNVSELVEELRTDIANVSHHLGVLHRAGLLERHKDGKYVVYSLHPSVFRPKERGAVTDAIDLGCCRIDLGQ